MSVLFILLPLALVIAIAAVIVFVWATRSGQFDDLDTPPHRVLFDDEEREGGGSEPRAAGSDAEEGG